MRGAARAVAQRAVGGGRRCGHTWHRARVRKRDCRENLKRLFGENLVLLYLVGLEVCSDSAATFVAC